MCAKSTYPVVHRSWSQDGVLEGRETSKVSLIVTKASYMEAISETQNRHIIVVLLNWGETAVRVGNLQQLEFEGKNIGKEAAMERKNS